MDPDHAIKRLMYALPEGMVMTNSRNYQIGSVYVQRGNKILGLCLDRVPEKVLHDLELDPDTFPDLIDLVVRSTSLRDLPSWVHEFNQVENLILKGLDMQKLALDLTDFRRLRFLAMPNNSLSELPSLDANNIFRLNLNRNRFEEFPQSVTELPNLVSLMIDENFLTSMPDSIASSVMQAISAENNQLSTFPGFLEHQMQLHSADLSRNFIQEIPPWITHFTELEYLNLGWNQIRIVPEEIASLTRIRLLELQSNPLEDFDISCLYGLTNLGILNLEDTFSLTTIPEKIRAYRKLFDLKFVIKY